MNTHKCMLPYKMDCLRAITGTVVGAVLGGDKSNRTEGTRSLDDFKDTGISPLRATFIQI